MIVESYRKYASREEAENVARAIYREYPSAGYGTMVWVSSAPESDGLWHVKAQHADSCD